MHHAGAVGCVQRLRDLDAVRTERAAGREGHVLMRALPCRTPLYVRCCVLGGDSRSSAPVVLRLERRGRERRTRRRPRPT
jgi:hypothetical protein